MLTTSIISVYVYVFMEWLFFATKPSFLTGFESWEKLLILFTVSVPFILCMLFGVGSFFLLDVLVSNQRLQKLWVRLALILPSFVFTATCLLLADNFSYTIFHFGVVSTKGWGKIPYALGVIFLFFLVYRFILKRREKAGGDAPGRLLTIIIALLLVFSFVAAVFSYQTRIVPREISRGKTQESTALPNIILIASDGWNASHASFYGYERETTPFISRFIKDRALICDNAFSNSGNSCGAIGALLTGKLPTSTRVYGSPDILTGIDSYQHLPAILRQYGYRNIDLGARYYADAYDMNMLNSFDVANFRAYEWEKGCFFFNSILDQGSVYFLKKMVKRLQDRIMHIAGICAMINPYEVMTKSRKEKFGDEKRIRGLLEFIKETKGPFFAHLHMFATHGPRFHICNPVFSRGETQDREWMKDFYDDALLGFDENFKRIVTRLKRLGKLDNTIFVFHSDHGMAWSIGVRIPLVFVFPDGAYAGHVRGNTQLLDVAPTILDYLGISPPKWMQGQSLISGTPDGLRPIFCTRPCGQSLNEEGVLVHEGQERGPPFFSLGTVTVIIQGKVFVLDLDPVSYYTFTVKGHTGKGTGTSKISGDAEVLRMILDHISRSGYDVSTLRNSAALKPWISSPSGYDAAESSAH